MSDLGIGFHGAVGTVTGSKYLVRSADRRVLIDCGMFQGVDEVHGRNWQPFPFDAARLDAVVLTHAHLDHSGLLPLLQRDGFEGPVYCTAATEALAGVLLPDSGRIHEEDARYLNRRDFSRQHLARPLFTEEEAKNCLSLLRAVPFGVLRQIVPGLTIRFRRAGHILGASWLQLETSERRLTFSGDLGRPRDVIMHSPQRLEATDYLIVESTYGDRKHSSVAAETTLADVINRTAQRGGLILIPAFAIGRVQQVLYCLWTLLRKREIPELPIFLDSPMAVNASEIFCRHPEDHRLSQDQAQSVCDVADCINTVEESRALNQLRSPAIILSASGMASGGRILHHLKAHIGHPANTVLFTGYQAEGTRGAKLLGGAEAIEIHGDLYPVRAQVCELHGLSAHADADEVIDWLRATERAPERTFVTHGEPAASAALCQRLRDELGWTAVTPQLDEWVRLD